MKREGGHKAPAPMPVVLSAKAIRRAVERAGKIGAYRGYADSSLTWKRGIRPDACLVGFLGEEGYVEFGKMQGFPATVDDRLLPHGDRGIDDTVWGSTISVKTQGYVGDPFLIKRRDKLKRIVPLVADVFVFCRVTEMSTVWVLGWCLQAAIRQYAPERRSRVKRNDWLNLELPLRHLEPPGSLCDHLDNVRRRAAC